MDPETEKRPLRSTTNLLPTTNLLSTTNLHYDVSGRAVIQGLDLSFSKGEWVGIIGPNGVGKSTLLKLLAGMLSPQRGGVTLGDRNILSLKRKAVAQTISLVPQETLIPVSYTVREVVAMGRSPYRGRFESWNARDHHYVEEALKETGLAAHAERFVNELSGGERQRVLIARSFAQQGSIQLLDEPISSLDVAYQLDILELLSARTEQGVLTITALHDLNFASRFCDRLLLLHEGAVVEDGAPEKVLTKNNLKRVFDVDVEVFRSEVLDRVQVVPISAKHNPSKRKPR